MDIIQKHILLVEDNPADAELIRVILTEKKHSAYMLHVKERLGEAMDFLSARKTDLVLLDLGLPDSHGVATIQTIKAQYPFIHRWFPRIKVQTGVKCYESIPCFSNGPPDFKNCPVAKTLKDGKTHKYTAMKGDITYQLLSSPLKDGNSRVKGAVLLVEDITERVSVETRLRQAQKMESLGTLAGGVAHDFNNILTAIHGFATLAKSEADKRDSLRDDLSEILKAAQRAGDLVKQILTFSRMGEWI